MKRTLARIFAVSVLISLTAFSIAEDPATHQAFEPSTPAGETNFAALRAQRRAVWEQYLDASPIERTDLHVGPYLSEMESAYKLDATQFGIVREKLESIAAARKAKMGQLAVEHEDLADRAAEIWWSYREAGELADDSPNPLGSIRNDPHYREIRERMVEIERQFPIDWDATISDVESLLPPDQAARGRVSLHKNRIELAARIARKEAVEAERQSRQTAGRVSEKPIDQDRSAPLIKAARGNTARSAGAGNKTPEPNAPARTAAANKRKNAGPKSRQATTESSRPNEIARNLDRWETFTRDFVARHHLTAEQQAAALSIMSELRSRAESLRKSHSATPASGAGPAELARLERQRAEIDQRVERLFDQLTRRLEALLTVEQRRASASKPEPSPKKDN
ncbi:MAG: hypothetical protein H6818_21580 [Phycisphaerales bacterium]|nr:hypothetical protein [Phycisphaerales bacterium]MCB9862382.1 hypothetical protein [Phycisphaerales bacterium]